MRFIARCSSLPELPLEKKKNEVPLCICVIVGFILVFFLVIWMSLFCVVMLREQLLKSSVTHQKTNFPAVLI